MAEPDIMTSADEIAASTDLRRGYLSGPGFTDVPVTYSVVNGIALFNGCIDMGPVEEVERETAAIDVRLATEAARSTASAAGGADHAADGDLTMHGIGLPPSSGFLWPNGVVPYVIDGALPNRARVTAAIAHFAEHTGIRFVPRTTQTNHIRFVSNGDAGFSSSPIGMRGGAQLIRISNGASTGTVIHECCHSLGMLHEQSRCDRDQYVEIRYQNVKSGFESNFDRFCSGFVDYYDYDFGSIMHYPAKAFTTNGQDTIVPRVSGVTIGQRSELSFGDRLTLAEMYSRFSGKGHTGVWRSGTGAYALWVNVPWDSFTDKWREWGRQGLRLVDLHVRRDGGTMRYTGTWLPGSGGYGLWANASWDSFTDKWREWGRQGLRLVDINVIQVGGQTRYSGVWLPGSGGYGLWANASWGSFVAKWREWSRNGLRLVDVNAHRTPTGTRWSGVFLPGNDGYYLWANTTWQGFRAKWRQLAQQGLRLIDYEYTEPFAPAGVDAAGLPAAPVEADAGSGGGVVLTAEAVLDTAAPGVAAAAEQVDVAGDGQGALVTTAASDGDSGSDTGQGEAVGLGAEASVATGDDGEGVGGLVLPDDAEAGVDGDVDARADGEGVGGVVGIDGDRRNGATVPSVER